MKKLILNADDYGATDFIDNGIIKGIKEGIVISVSVLVNHTQFEKRVVENLLPVAREYGVKIGLHLSITSGSIDQNREVEPRSMLAEGSQDFSHLNRIILNRIAKAELLAEIKYQIEKLGRALGGVQHIEHINSHHGIFYFDHFLLSSLMEVLYEYKNQGYTFHLRSPLSWSKSGLPYYDYDRKYSISIRRQAIRNALGSPIFVRGRFNTIKRLFLGTRLKFINYVQRTLADYSNEHTFCFIDQWYGQTNQHHLNHIIEKIPAEPDKVIEFMLHLGDEETPHDYAPGINPGYYHHRKMELKLLSENKHLLEEVEIVNYSPSTWP